MIGLESFDEEELLRFARLIKTDEDFKAFVKYLTVQVTGLALKSTRFGGDEGEKLKGASIILQELRDLLIQAPEVLQGVNEEKELEGRDTISP